MFTPWRTTRRKRLRLALSGLLFRLGHTDFSNPISAVAALSELQLVRAVFH